MLSLRAQSINRLYLKGGRDESIATTAVERGIITANEYAEITGVDYQVSLAKAKEIAINNSKQQLRAWLVANPLVSTVHNNTAGTYTVTEEKQIQLALNVISHTMAMQAGSTEAFTWNEAGKECEVWTMEEATRLLFEIKAYVKPRISEQQGYEALVNAAESIEAINAIVIDFALCPHAHS